MNRRRVHVVVSGRVQSVGFRMFVLRTAQRLQLSGWVRNSDDRHQVELEAEGSATAVDALIAALRIGPPAARVRDVAVEPRTVADTEPGGFEVW